MKPLICLIAVFAACLSMAACAYVGLSPDYPSANIRYKMTVEVETPEGVKTGSAVREISMVSRPMLLGESNDTHVKLEKGEAVVVDLGQRGVLFVLMSIGGGGGQAVWAPFNAFPSPCPEGAVSRCGVKYYSSLKSADKAVLKPQYYPGVVRFKDINKPLTVERVIEMVQCTDNEIGISSNHCIKTSRFEEFFGEGVRLKSIQVEITEDEITQKIETFLPWLGSTEGHIDGQRYGGGPALSNILERSDFSVGEEN